MSINNGDDTQWSLNSFDESDLGEYETKLYSMVYHNSNAYDEPTPGRCPGADLISTADNNKNSETHTNLAKSVPNSIINVEPPNPIRNIQYKFHRSSRSKASRLDQVNKIIDFADNKHPSGDKATARRNRPDSKNRKNIMYSKKQSTSRPTNIPKTASLYFQNLTKSLNNVQYFQKVETQLPKAFDPIKAKSDVANSSQRTVLVNSCHPADRSALANFTFAEICNKAPGVVPVFRLDDRLFPNTPRNTSKEEVELSQRLFSNQSNELAIDRDRHNHLFNQLPTIPIPSIPMTKKDRLSLSTRKKKRNTAKAKRKIDKNSRPSTLFEIPPLLGAPQTNNNIVLPAIITQLNSILSQDRSNMVDLGDDPIEVLHTANASLSDCKALIINLDPSIDGNEIINLDSDSADSIVVITPPSRTPPPVIALSDEEDFVVPPPHRLLETQHVDNSFDFLDSCDEPDGLSRSQVSVFTRLISDGGSKESLLDDRLFQRLNEFGVNVCLKPNGEVDEKMPAPVGHPGAPIVRPKVLQTDQASTVDSLSRSSAVNAVVALVKQSSSLCAHPRVRKKKEQVFLLDSVDRSSVVNVDESSESTESVESVSNPIDNSGQNVHVRKSTRKSTLILNVQEDSLDNSEINKILNETSRSFEDVVAQDRDPEARSKRKRGRQDEGSESSPKKKKKRGKKAREKSRHQLQEFLQTRSGMPPLLYTKIEGDYSIGPDELRPRYPTKWTRDMRRYYTDSWGGEGFDVQTVQRTMSADQSLWRISWEDRRGPVPLQGPHRRSRCYNCSRFGHPMAMCPEPHRVSKCHMCGEPGHQEPTCPNKICLQCGRSTSKYSNGCWECQHVPHGLCTKCIWKHDPAVPCMDVRRNPVLPGYRPDAVQMPDPRERIDHKRSRFGSRSLGSGRVPWNRGGEPANADIRPYFDKRKSSDYHSPQKYGGPPVVRKQSFRRSRP